MNAAMTATAAESVVLLVEDEEESRESLREILELEGYHVELATNGQEALAKLDHIAPCVILLDLFMPVMDGWQLLEKLRSDGRLDKLNILVTTSAATNLPTDVPVFTKPLDIDHLMQTLGVVC
jgi:CheY-like chemotaxis protein